jgi:hypothetical protein
MAAIERIACGPNPERSPRTMDLHTALMSSPLLRELETINRGEKQLSDSAAKRHHLVPEFILRHFAVIRDGRDRLVQLDVRTGAPRWVGPRDAASRHRFYRVTWRGRCAAPEDRGVPGAG